MRTEIDLNEFEHFLKANLDQSYSMNDPEDRYSKAPSETPNVA